MDVTVKAGLSAMSMLRSSDVVPYVDLNGLDVGSHEVAVQFEIPKASRRKISRRRQGGTGYRHGDRDHHRRVGIQSGIRGGRRRAAPFLQRKGHGWRSNLRHLAAAGKRRRRYPGASREAAGCARSGYRAGCA